MQRKTLLLVILIFALASLVSTLTIQKSYYINDGVLNFMYGSNGVKNYFESITRPPNAIKCPSYKPFTDDGTKCFKCSTEKPIFNLTTKRCENCPTGIEGL